MGVGVIVGGDVLELSSADLVVVVGRSSSGRGGGSGWLQKVSDGSICTIVLVTVWFTSFFLLAFALDASS